MTLIGIVCNAYPNDVKAANSVIAALKREADKRKLFSTRISEYVVPLQQRSKPNAVRDLSRARCFDTAIGSAVKSKENSALICAYLISDLEAAQVRRYGGTVWHCGSPPPKVRFEEKHDLFVSIETDKGAAYLSPSDAFSVSLERQPIKKRRPRKNPDSTLGNRVGGR